jgi:MFS family permease
MSYAGAVGGVAGGLVADWALRHWAFPHNFAYLLLAAGLIMPASVLLYLFTHEPAPENCEEETEQRLGGMLRQVWGEDRRLRRLIAVRYVMEFAGAGTIFLAVYALKRFALPDASAGLFALALSLGSAVGAPLVGRIGDRRGWRRAMAGGLLAVAGAFALVLGTGRAELVYGVFFLVGLAGAADWMGYVNLLVEMSEDARRGYYQALAASSTLAPRLVGPFFWGWLGDKVGLGPVFTVCLTLTLAAWVLLVALVDDPRRPGQRVLHRSGQRPPWFTWR